MGVDWLNASRTDRQTLYRHVKPLVDRRYGGDWSRLYQAAFGQAVAFGQGYEDNFRAGRISRKRAAALFDFIAAHHADEAAEIARSLDASVAALDWDQFVDANGVAGRLRIVPLDDPTLTIVAFAARTRVERIRLGQSFWRVRWRGAGAAIGGRAMVSVAAGCGRTMRAHRGRRSVLAARS